LDYLNIDENNILLSGKWHYLYPWLQCGCSKHC